MRHGDAKHRRVARKWTSANTPGAGGLRARAFTAKRVAVLAKERTALFCDKKKGRGPPARPFGSAAVGILTVECLPGVSIG
jgi:hypothetical protein